MTTTEMPSRASVRDLLEGADIAILLMTLVQLTGETRWLDEAAPHIHGAWDHDADLPPELADRIRDALADVLQAGKAAEAGQPSPDLFQRMMSVCVGAPVSDDYVPMLMSEMGFAPPEWTAVDEIAPAKQAAGKQMQVVVVGAGISGLCTAIGLKRLGVDFTVFEKDERVGGTWWENSYPGAGVDTSNHMYSYSFELNHGWSRYYAKRDELHEYLEHCARKYELLDHIEFGTSVEDATWDESSATWSVKVRSQDGVRQLTANAIVTAVGQLNRPQIPHIDGADTFRGNAFHTARWDHEEDLTGKRVAMIGSGASALQAGPAIASQVAELQVFQRSAQWTLENANYDREVGEGKRWALEHVPFYTNWYRFQLFWAAGDGIYPTLVADPEWPTPERSINAANEAVRETLTRRIETLLEGRPDLIEKAVPDYPPFGKRMLKGDQWYSMLKRPNVRLVTVPVDRIEPDGIRTADGELHQADVLIWATGFAAREMLAPLNITGRGGKTLREVWGAEDPRAYLGLTVPEFPNFFVTFGPNTVLAHGGSAIFHTECQVRYTMQALRALAEGPYRSMECREDVHDEYNARVDETHSQMIWAHPGMNNWYKNSKGRVVMTTPWKMIDYWTWTSALNPDDFTWKA